MFLRRFFNQTPPKRDYSDNNGKSKVSTNLLSYVKGRKLIALISVITLSCVLGYISLQTMKTPARHFVYAPPPQSILDVSASSRVSLIESNIQASKSPASKLTFVYEMISCGCGGFQTETVDIILGLYYANTVRRLALMAPESCWCPGYPQDIVNILEYLRTQPYQQWDIDVFVRHAGPTNMIPKWPYLDIPKRPKVVIGRTMVEIDKVIPDWLKHLDHVDDVWVPSKHSLEAFTKVGADPNKFAIVQEPIESSLYDPTRVFPLPIARGKFTFLSIFKWESRKGVDALLRAFFEEFTVNDDVSLIISTHLYGADNEYQPETIKAKVREYVEQLGLDAKPRALPLDRVIIISERLPTVDMLRLYRTADAFVMPTHGEGWGLPIVEAMMMERPTIATDYSGVREYLNADVGFPIRTKGLEPAMGRGFEHWMEWASVDVRHLKQLMRRVFNLPVAERHAIGRRARQHIMGKFSRRSIADQIKGRLEVLVDKFQLSGSAQSTCLREYKAERARARSLGVLGSAYTGKAATTTAAAEEDLSDVSATAIAASSGAVTGAEDWVLRVCTAQGTRSFYRQWEGRMLSQYQYWPLHESVDDEASLDSAIYDPTGHAYDQRRDIIDKIKQSEYASARNVYLSSLPESIVPTAADSDPWEVRRARERLLAEMRPQAEVDRERRLENKKEAKRKQQREQTLRRLQAERQAAIDADRAAAKAEAKAKAEAAAVAMPSHAAILQRGVAAAKQTGNAAAALAAAAAASASNAYSAAASRVSALTGGE